MKKTIAVLAASTFILAACQQTGQKQTAGTLLGAVGGAVAGAQFGGGKGQLAATAVGTLLGAYVGSEIGASLDRADMLYANQAAQQAFEAKAPNQTVAWQNPDSGNRGTITPTSNSYVGDSGRYCRQYEQTIFIEGKSQTAYGTACRNQYGEWEIQ